MRGFSSLVSWVGALLAVAQAPAGSRLLARTAAAAVDGQPPAAETRAAAPAVETQTNGQSPAAEDPCAAGTRALLRYQALYSTPSVAPVSGRGEGNAQAPPLRHLIALVPDPVESGYPDYYDAVVEGVQEAVAFPSGGSSYLRDRGWLPWPGRRATTHGQRRCWGTQPGVLVYRPQTDPATSYAIVVLLVGETPTWGLQERQFERALTLVDDFAAWWPSKQGGDEYRIVGPTFSGTAASLAAAIRKHATPRTRRFAVASGTATSPDVASTVKGIAAGASDGEGRVSYSPVTPQDPDLLTAMRLFLCQRGGHCEAGRDPNIALLTESLTSYGSAGAEREPKFLELKFPPSLAPIRTPNSDPVDSTGDTSGAAPPDGAPLAQGTSDTALSKNAGVAHDLALAEVLRGLSARHVRFIGILATDALDVVFLAQRIRSEFPDVRLFTLSTDVRYLTPDYAPFLNGMLVAHSVPPAIDNHSTSLKNEMVGSVFNAARTLLGDPAPPPAVRISLIGNGAFWQIDADRIGGEPVDPASCPRRPCPTTPVSWSFVTGFFGAAFFVIFLLVEAPWLGDVVARRFARAQERVGFLRHRGPLWAMVEPCQYADLRADDTVVTAALLTVAASPTILLITARFAREGDSPSWGNAVLSIALVALSLGINAWTVAAQWRPQDPSAWGAALLAGSATLASIIALGLGCGPQSEATLNLMSGGSPVVAGLIGLTILGLGLWCWRVRLRFLDMHAFGVSRRALFRGVTPPIALALGERLGSDDRTGLAEVEQRLLRVIRNPWASFPLVPVAVHAFTAGCILIALLIKPPQTFERGWRNTLVVGFACLTILPITGNFARLLATWAVLRRLLQRLAHSPVLAAMAGLPPALARSLTAQVGLSGSEVVDLAWPVEALGALAAAHGSFRDQAEACAEVLRRELRCEAGTRCAPDALEGRADRAELVSRLLDASAQAWADRDGFSEEVRRLADALAATLVAVFVPRYVRHFRLFVPPLIVGSVLGVLMTSVYFVQPQRLIASLIFVSVAAMVLAIFGIYIALDRDPVISAIAGTKAGVVTWDWALGRRIVVWGLFPMASLLAAQYPQFSSWISTLFGIVAKGFK